MLGIMNNVARGPYWEFLDDPGKPLEGVAARPSIDSLSIKVAAFAPAVIRNFWAPDDTRGQISACNTQHVFLGSFCHLINNEYCRIHQNLHHLILRVCSWKKESNTNTKKKRNLGMQLENWPSLSYEWKSAHAAFFSSRYEVNLPKLRPLTGCLKLFWEATWAKWL